MEPTPQEWEALRALYDWLAGDAEGRAILARLRTDPQGALADLARWAANRQPPPSLATYVSGGQVERLINIAQAGIVLLPMTPSRPAPDLLPPDIADFTGRAEYLEQVTACLEKAAQGGGPALVISAVAGLAGVGKSALAIHAAHRLKDRFPDARLYINLRGAEGTPLPPADALGTFLVALGVEKLPAPDDLQARSGLYRSLLSDRRALVLLDNAHDEAQVRPLLPGSPTCAVLITSRRPLTALEGAETVDLPPMPEEEAIALLEAIVGAGRVQSEPDAARRIARLCGYLPLALRVAGGTLKEKPHWSLAQYAGWLADERKRLERLQLGDLDVRAALGLSYRELRPEEKRLFRLPALLAGPDFGPELVAVMAGADVKDVWEGLERLVDARLLDAADGRYRFHDLVRLFARERLEEEEAEKERLACRLRAARWLNQRAGEWAALLTPGDRRRAAAQEVAQVTGRSAEEVEREWEQEALAGFERERENLVAAVEWADGAGDEPLTVALAGNLWQFFALRAHWPEWEKTHERALAA
ncbi:MAG: NB-ARC domain-containing protein, partial [Anaerolineae bacterium]